MTLYNAAIGSKTAPLRWMDVLTVLLSAVLLTLSAKLKIPFYPVPMTMQTLVVIGLGLALGPSRGVASVLLYLAMGSLGLPVFAGTPEKGIGLTYMVGPTGGYLVGYLLAVMIAGWLAVRGWDRHPLSAALAAVTAAMLVYVPGLLWLGYVIGWEKPVMSLGFYPFLLADILKALIASIAFPAAWRWLSSRGLQ